MIHPVQISDTRPLLRQIRRRPPKGLEGHGSRQSIRQSQIDRRIELHRISADSDSRGRPNPTGRQPNRIPPLLTTQLVTLFLEISQHRGFGIRALDGCHEGETGTVR